MSLKEEKREEKTKFFIDVLFASKALSRDLTKKSPYIIPVESPIMIDIIAL